MEILSGCLLVVSGTRPEILKLYPIIEQLKQTPIKSKLLITNQQENLTRNTLLDLGLDSFNLESTRLGDATLVADLCRMMKEIDQMFQRSLPVALLVQGDTLSVLASAQVASFHKIPIFYVESGLRSFNKFAPFPEEMVRKTVSHLSTYNFAPTKISATNLIREGVNEESIHVVGNTSIDNLRLSINHEAHHDLLDTYLHLRDKFSEIVLVTSHRRELTNEERMNISLAINQLSEMHPDWLFIFPQHSNPRFSQAYNQFLIANENIHKVSPLSNREIIALLRVCSIVMTDSGGIQEEATALACPMIVLREQTERPECLQLESCYLGIGGVNDLVKRVERVKCQRSLLSIFFQIPILFISTQDRNRVAK